MNDKTTTNKTLDALLARLHCDETNPQASLQRHWNEILGSDLAVHARLVDIKATTLVIEVDHPARTQAVLLRKREILSRIATSYPALKVRYLQLRIHR
jgi:hypothetical protein